MQAPTPSLLPLADPHRPREAEGCGSSVPRSTMGKRRAAVLIGVHLLVFLHVWHWLSTGRTLTPLEPSEAGETLLTGAVNAGFLLFALAILATLVVGRFFCGWVCHVVAYQDLAAALLRKVGLAPRPVRSRLLLFVPFYAAFSMFLWPSIRRHWVDGEPLPALTWHLTTEGFWDRFPGLWVSLATFLVCGGLIVWILGAKGFCTYACPYGAFFGLVGRHAPGRIRVSDACEGCGHCTAVCTSAVRVHAEVARFGQVVDPGCMRCLDCVSACPKDALSFGFARDERAKAKGRLGFLARLRRPPKENARWDFRWSEEVLLLIAFAVSVWSLRGAYGQVPFLLALGLAVLVAFGCVTWLRLVLQRDLTVQHAAWRREGRFTSWGALGLAGLPLAFGLVAHTGTVQYHAREGERLLVEVAADPRGDQERLPRAVEHLRSASSLALIDTFKLENQLGQALVRVRDEVGARRHLERAIELEPERVSARVELAWIHARAQDPSAAAATLSPVVEDGIHDARYVGAVARMLERYGDDADLRALEQRMQAAFAAATAEGSPGPDPAR